MGGTDPAGWGGAGSVVVVGGSVVVVVVEACTAAVVADRSFLDNECDSRRAVKSKPDPAAALMRATPVTVRATAGSRPNLSTHRGIGERRQRLETHGIGLQRVGCQNSIRPLTCEFAGACR